MRTAVITGGSSGIGLEVARLLSQRGGWQVVLAARDPDRLAAAASSLGATPVVCDVGSDADVAGLSAVSAGLGGCDLLVQCAGGSRGSSLASGTVDDFREALELNYLGLIRVFAALWPQIAERHGRIVNVVSVAGAIPLERSAPYSCAKHAALAWSRALVAPARAAGVVVTTANPGPVPTPGFPQTSIVGHRLGALLLIDVRRCAAGIVRASDRGRAEVFLPARYRLPAAVQGIAPGLTARVLASRHMPRVASGSSEAA
ncbi:MAG TPA: SDR family NAD(P)-dependent oxidoreductase [Gaiellales bacterium]|jgi:short-subunit dehydrogenase